MMKRKRVKLPRCHATVMETKAGKVLKALGVKENVFGPETTVPNGMGRPVSRKS